MKQSLGYAVLFLGLIVIGCGDPSNPFLNASDSKAVIDQMSFQNGDTVNIFSTETLSVVVYLRENLNYYCIHIDHNRLWSLPDSIIDRYHFSEEPARFTFSFYDTGEQKIKLVYYRNNDPQPVEEDITLYAKSPLQQEPVTASVGKTVRLETPPVNDDDVIYVWDFHDGNIIRDNQPRTSFILKTLQESASLGELYVKDHKYQSPSTRFEIHRERLLQ